MIFLKLAVNSRNYDAVYGAARHFDYDTLRTLIKNGSSLDININGTTPATQLISEGRHAAAELLVSFGSCINQQAEYYARLGNVRRVEQLEALGANTNYSGRGFAYAHNDVQVFNRLADEKTNADPTFVLTGYILSGQTKDVALDHLLDGDQPQRYLTSYQAFAATARYLVITKPIKDLAEYLKDINFAMEAINVSAEMRQIDKICKTIQQHAGHILHLLHSMLGGFINGGHDDLFYQTYQQLHVDIKSPYFDFNNDFNNFVLPEDLAQAGHLHRTYETLQYAKSKPTKNQAFSILNKFIRSNISGAGHQQLIQNTQRFLYFAPQKKDATLFLNGIKKNANAYNSKLVVKEIKDTFEVLQKFKCRYQIHYIQAVTMLDKNTRYWLAIGIKLSQDNLMPIDIYLRISQYLIALELENIRYLFEAVMATRVFDNQQPLSFSTNIHHIFAASIRKIKNILPTRTDTQNIKNHPH